jgi:hypothetical protein
LKGIQDWHASNQVHFPFGLLSNQPQSPAMFKSYQKT